MRCRAGVGFAAADQARVTRLEEPKAAANPGDDGGPRLTLLVPEIRCGQCIATIERALQRLPQVAAARVRALRLTGDRSALRPVRTASFREEPA